MVSGPVLPWGNESQTRKRSTNGTEEPSGAAADAENDNLSKRQRADAASESTTESPGNGLLLPDVGLSTGSRIKVKWQLDLEEDGTSEIRWWGATVMDPKAGESTGVNTYHIMYDEQDGFGAASAEVRFLGPSELYDMGCDTHPEGRLRWKLEGDGLEDVSDDEEFANEVVTMSELHEEFVGDPEAEEDEQQALQELGNLPWERQAHIASGFRDMVDAIKEGLGDIVGKGGADKAITPDDIKTIFSRLASRK